MNAWNAYLWPKVIMTDNKAITMPMLIANLITGYVTDYGMLMCGCLLYTSSPDQGDDNNNLRTGGVSKEIISCGENSQFHQNTVDPTVCCKQCSDETGNSLNRI